MSTNHEQTDVQVVTIPGQRAGVTVLSVSGPLTIRNFFEFQTLARQKSSPVLIVDLSEVPYIDSAALGSLVGVHVSCERDGRKYAVTGVSPRIRTVFQVSHVDQILITFPTVAEAEAALA